MRRFPLMPLPYSISDLEPLFSANAVETHYEQHHRKYCHTLNLLLAEEKLIEDTLEDVIRTRTGKVFNQAAQVWNHSFYWAALTPKRVKPLLPSSSFLALIEKSFLSFESFKAQYLQEAMQLFGSGWIWLIATKEGDLKILTTANGDTPLRSNVLPLLCTDLWEHAYYLDYQSGRSEYMKQWWKLINWAFVENQFSQPFAYLKPLSD